MDFDGSLAVSLAVLTLVLVVATIYYARQTRNTVQELRMQRKQADRRDVDARVSSIVEAQTNLSNELRQIVANLENPSGTGRNFMKLPVEAWHASFSSEIVLPSSLREALFDIYSEVERLNTLANMMLAGRGGAPQTGPNFADSSLGLDRHGAGESLALRIGEILPEFDNLPPPEGSA